MRVAGEWSTSSLAEVRQERVGQEARVEPIQKLALLWGFIPRIPADGLRVSELGMNPR